MYEAHADYIIAKHEDTSIILYGTHVCGSNIIALTTSEGL